MIANRKSDEVLLEMLRLRSSGAVEAYEAAKSSKAPTLTRAGILDAALECVTRDRQATHGAPETSFATIAAYWSVHTGAAITATDVAVMLALLKVARIQSSPAHGDNWIDLAGYAACGGELATSAEGRAGMKGAYA